LQTFLFLLPGLDYCAHLVTFSLFIRDEGLPEGAEVSQTGEKFPRTSLM
jgi:hypothetical protein